MGEMNPEPQEGQDQTPEPTGQEQGELDYNSLSEEQADRLLQQEYGNSRPEEQMAAPLPETDQPEPADEPEPAEPETVEGQEAAEPQQPAAEVEPPQLTANELEAQELRLRLEQAENARQRQEFLASRFSGHVGRLQQQIEALQGQLAGQQQPQQEPGYEPQYPAPPPQQIQQPSADQSRLAELEATARDRAITEEYQAFQQRLSQQLLQDGEDVSTIPSRVESILTEMAPAIQEAASPYTDMRLNLRSAQKVTRLVLDAAHQQWQLDKIRTLREQARQRTAVQTRQVVEDKKAATISGSGGAPPPKPRRKTPQEMTAEEADKELIRQFGDGHARLRS